jgi:molybdate transport repressor ModE-like protein
MANDDERTLDVGRLKLLREVALRGTIAAAARSLGLTSSAVSQQLGVLEREAATALVDRSPRGVSLTGAGHALVERAEQVLDVLAAARADLDRIAGSVSGPVSLAAVASAAVAVVSPAITALRAQFPGIDVEVSVAEPSAALALLLAGDVDLAVVDEYDYVPLALPDFVLARPLCAEPLVAVVAAGWPGRRRPALVDFAALDWVMPPEDVACGVAVRSACRAAGFEPRVRWSTDDMRVLVSAVAAGHGVAVLPRLSVAAEAAGIEVLTLREPQLSRRLLAAGRASTLGRPVIDVTLAHLARSALATQSTRRSDPPGER